MRIVIKVGTNLITSSERVLDKARLGKLAADIASLRRKSHEVVVVSSGAIGAGMGRMKLSRRPDSLKEKQALAAIGQPLLMDAYKAAFEGTGITVAQVLLTRQDFDDRQRYLNARNTLLSLMDMGVVTIINENDTVAVDEIKFGENDTLSAMVAAKICADCLIMLTDVDGLYEGVPGRSRMVEVVDKITSDVEKLALSVSESGKGVGGMHTKVQAAKIAVSAGVRMVIANGREKNIVSRIIAGEKLGTLFVPKKTMDARQCWIAFGASNKGRIFVDKGAASAILSKGKSLLPAGITSVEGRFKVGDTVSVITEEGVEIAKGLTYYSSDDIGKIKGKDTSNIKKIIKNASYDEVIHRDNLAIL